MGEWYWIGLAVGLGVGCGILLAGFLAVSRAGLLAAGALAIAAGVGIGFLIENWDEALALPALAARLRRRSPERYAGLRTLARD